MLSNMYQTVTQLMYRLRFLGFMSVRARVSIVICSQRTRKIKFNTNNTRSEFEMPGDYTPSVSTIQSELKLVNVYIQCTEYYYLCWKLFE